MRGTFDRGHLEAVIEECGLETRDRKALGQGSLGTDQPGDLVRPIRSLPVVCLM